MNNLSTHPDFDLNLWMEARSSGGPDRNQVYRLSNTMTENLQMTHSVSIIGSSQLLPSTQSSKFTALLQQRVQEHTTHLNEKYEWLSADYEELHRMVMNIRSHMGMTNLLLLQRHFCYNFHCIWTYKFVINIWLLY